MHYLTFVFINSTYPSFSVSAMSPGMFMSLRPAFTTSLANINLLTSSNLPSKKTYLSFWEPDTFLNLVAKVGQELTIIIENNGRLSDGDPIKGKFLISTCSFSRNIVVMGFIVFSSTVAWYWIILSLFSVFMKFHLYKYHMPPLVHGISVLRTLFIWRKINWLRLNNTYMHQWSDLTIIGSDNAGPVLYVLCVMISCLAQRNQFKKWTEEHFLSTYP